MILYFIIVFREHEVDIAIKSLSSFVKLLKLLKNYIKQVCKQILFGLDIWKVSANSFIIYFLVG